MIAPFVLFSGSLYTEPFVHCFHSGAMSGECSVAATYSKSQSNITGGLAFSPGRRQFRAVPAAGRICAKRKTFCEISDRLIAICQ